MVSQVAYRAILLKMANGQWKMANGQCESARISHFPFPIFHFPLTIWENHRFAIRPRLLHHIARRESNPPVRFGRPTRGPLGHGHTSVGTAGFEPAFSAFRGPRPFRAGPRPEYCKLTRRQTKKGQASRDAWPARSSRKLNKRQSRSGYALSAFPR